MEVLPHSIMTDSEANTRSLLEDDDTETQHQGVDYKDWNGVDLIDSLCMNCGETGQTRLMLHKIPYFRELIIASFFCDHCGERNNEVTFGGEIQLQGCIYELQVTTPRDLDRQLIKSDSATVRLKEIDFEIPPLTQKGEISTIEGILRTAAKNLSLYQAQRMEDSPEIGTKVAEVIMNLTLMAGGSQSMMPFTIVVDDPAGNSYVENFLAPQVDPHMTRKCYNRSAFQDEALGLEANKGVFRDDKDSNFQALMQSTSEGGTIFGALKSNAQQSVAAATSGDFDSNTLQKVVEESADSVRLGRSEAVSIPSQCPNCRCIGESLTALTDIPHFKEVSRTYTVPHAVFTECGGCNNTYQLWFHFPIGRSSLWRLCVSLAASATTK